MQKKIIDRTQQTRSHTTTRHTTYKMVGEQRNGWESNGFHISQPDGSTMQEALAVLTSNHWATSQTQIKRWFHIETTWPERVKYFNQPFNDISWPYTATKEINKIIDSLKSKNSSGCDEIPTKIIKISKPFVISPLINICNKVLAQGNYPERLKFSLIKPIYKSGDKFSPSNYKPISILPAFSKIFEKVMYKRLFDH